MMVEALTFANIGTEHSYYERGSIVTRPALRWPGGEALAIAFVASVEYYELRPPTDAYVPVNVPGMFGRSPYPDFGSFSRREYGRRVGIFRLMQVLDEHGIQATAAIDACTAVSCPEILEECQNRRWALAGHGYSASRAISSRMSEAQERDYIGSALEALANASGRRVIGWHGVEYGESERTPRLLTELGLDYVMDWPNDEQPYFMNTGGARLVSIPMAADFDDVNAMWHRRLSTEQWTAAILEGVDLLLQDGRQSARLFVLNLHPWLIGQPFRAHALRGLLASLRERQGIWFTTTDALANWYRGNIRG